MTPLHDQVADLFCPLTDFYSSHRTRPPRITPIEGDRLPRPYRDLLVHDQDMTSTLEAHFGVALHVRVLEKLVNTSHLTRQVVLEGAEGDIVAEFGAIRIVLDRFGAEARSEILDCRLPLGTILNRRGVAFACRPNAFFSFESDEIARRAFHLQGSHILYGRHNHLVDSTEQPLAEVVEILPPLKAPATPEGP